VTKILFVLGTRPEAIKVAPIVLALQETEGVRPVVCTTGQHRELVDAVFATFGIVPDHDLALMKPNQALHDLTARALTALDPVFAEEKPAMVVVQGDTTTAMCGALGAFYRRVPVAHVEAGLRTGDLSQPFPEEANRRLVAPLASLHFAPTEAARQNLLREGIAAESIQVTGNTSVDAALWAARQPATARVAALAGERSGGNQGKNLVLITAHRRENFGEPLERICTAVRTLTSSHPQMRFVVSVHPNPNVKGVVHARLGGIPNLVLSDPLDYVDLIQLIARSFCILTDSGGIQEEAPALGAPVLVLRGRTERPEGVASGNARLVGTDVDLIVSEFDRLVVDGAWRARMSRPSHVYGDGSAAARIARALAEQCLPAHAAALIG
jgi:UDP-N-acetylglucosamine 2-epimerase (non-hydrolysing)